MGQAYYKTQESVEEYIRLAKGVDGSNLIEALKKVLPQKSKLLELGSGPGTDWNILNKTFQTIGSDFSSEFLKHLKIKYPEGTFLKLDSSDLKTGHIFDGIYSNKVLQHLNDKALSKSIQRQYEILSDKGVICHSFWKGDGDEIFKGLLVNYQSETSLKNLFKSHFEILSLSLYQEFEADDSILLIARKL